MKLKAKFRSVDWQARLSGWDFPGSGQLCTDANLPRALLSVNRSNRWRMASSGMLRRVALVSADVSEESSTCFIEVTRIGGLGTTLAVTSNRPGEGGDKFLRKVGSYKSHTA
jgi:hypothetical protein